jgi:glutamine synthetase
MDTVSQVAAGHAELADELRRRGVKYAMGGWIDVLGRSKSKIVPVDHLPQLLAGSERYTPRGMGGIGVMTPHEDECVALPDVSTLQVFPWDGRFAWMAADLSYGGREPFALCPRSALKRQLARAADAGYTVNLGVETEFYAFTADSVDAPPRIGEPAGYLRPAARSGALRPTPAYDTVSTLDAMPFLDRMADCMRDLGFGLFSFDHEGGDGQFEFDFAYDEALRMADRISLFRIMARAVAQEFGLIATFMPKPYTGGWGSGHHSNMSLADVSTGENLFREAGQDGAGGPDGTGGWTELTYAFVAGILRHARAIAAVATPTVNSYKRLTARLRDGEISWAPIWASYGDNNRSCMIRLPANRPAIENRAVDSAANTYLATALIVAAGLEGIEKNLHPGEPVTSQTYDWQAPPPGATRLPRTLLEAIEAFAEDPLVHEVFAPQFVTEYTAMKNEEWDSYHAEVTDWERTRYLLNL